MYWWNPNKIKELKEQGYKFKFYNYDPRLKAQTIEEIEDQDQVNTEDTQK